jgi:hypothetical protein
MSFTPVLLLPELLAAGAALKGECESIAARSIAELSTHHIWCLYSRKSVRPVQGLPTEPPGAPARTSHAAAYGEPTAVFTTPNLHSALAKLLFPFTRLLNRHELTVLESWGFPLDGSSPTSRPAMRLAARLVRPLLRSRFQENTLCLLLQRSGAVHPTTTGNLSKAAVLTAHYV